MLFWKVCSAFCFAEKVRNSKRLLKRRVRNFYLNNNVTGLVKNHTFSLRNLSALQLKFSLAIDKEYAAGKFVGRVILYF